MWCDVADVSTVSWTLLTLCATLVTWYLYRHFTQLRRLGLPGPTPLPFVGNLLEQLWRGTDKTDAEWFSKYGKVFGFYNGFRPSVMVGDPEIIKLVLVKNFPNYMDRPLPKSVPRLLAEGLFFMQGRKWKKTRNILTPSFSAAKLKYFVPIINKCAEQLVKNLQARVGEDVEIRKSYIHFTMDAIASTAFGIDIDSQNQPDDPFVSNIDAIFKPRLSIRIFILLAAACPPLATLLKLFGFSAWPYQSVRFYEQTGQALIDERKKHKMPRVDFIEMLLNAEFDADRAEYVHGDVSAVDGHAGEAVNEKLTDAEINGQAFTFFLAGFETTASLLRYVSHTLALHPNIDKRLYEEIEEHIGEEEPTYANLANLKYMEQVINETLRFYPPVLRLNRQATADLKHGDLVIPRGADIFVPVWHVHHDPELYPDPEKFDPDRFSAERKTSGDGITFLAFGLGPRHCIGLRLAMVEAKIALVHLLRNFRFEKCEQTQVPLQLRHVGLLRPFKPIVVKVQRR